MDPNQNPNTSKNDMLVTSPDCFLSASTPRVQANDMYMLNHSDEY